MEDLNYYKNFFSFKKTWFFNKLIQCVQRVIFLGTGNQTGKTGSVAYQYVMRILGVHPVAKRNVVYFECIKRAKLNEAEDYVSAKESYFKNHKSLDSATWGPLKKPDKCQECGSEVIQHERVTRTFRFASQSLPGQTADLNEHGMSAEIKNTQYPAIKKWLPPNLIKKDITHRSPSMIIKDPFGGADIVGEFVSYNQEVQSTAGVQRLSVWEDEQPSKEFRNEQTPRLLAEDGDEIITLTPANYISWVFDDIYEHAEVYYRTKAICDHIRRADYEPKQIEHTGKNSSIAVIQAASDDNPILNQDVVEEMFKIYENDPDEYDIRRYGLFRQISGRIFKSFTPKTHVISSEKYFPQGVPHSWNHARGIDYHAQTAWACLNLSISDTNECFIWGEVNPSPEKYTTNEICEQIASISKDYKFKINLVDPHAKAIKKNSITILDDINEKFRLLKRENTGTGGWWTVWDTKGEKGRDEIKKRLKNSLTCGKPFNNAAIKDGQKVCLPTLWILDTCPQAAKSMRQWRWEQYSEPKLRQTKGEKNIAEQRWSHFNMVIEACFKNPLFKAKNHSFFREEKAPQYFRAR